MNKPMLAFYLIVFTTLALNIGAFCFWRWLHEKRITRNKEALKRRHQERREGWIERGKKKRK